MKSGNIKHSVLIISYFQEDYIGTTIESVLNQTELPYEIIISDDCSKDDTWNIIQRYQKKHPDLIRAYRNDPNIGIFQNLEKVLKAIIHSPLSYRPKSQRTLEAFLRFVDQSF